MNRGWIKLHRKIEDSFLFSNSKAMLLWIFLLISANHAEKEFLFNGKKMICKRGQILTGRDSISSKIKINRSSVDRLLKVFESEHLIEQHKTNRFRLITVINYDLYQSSEHLIEQQMSNKRATNEQQMSTNNNDKNEKNNKNEKNINIYVPFTPPTIDEITSYCSERSNTVNPEKFFDFYQSKGWMVGKNKMKDWRACVRTWEKSENQFQKGGKNYESKSNGWTNGVNRDEARFLLERARRNEKNSTEFKSTFSADSVS